MLIQDDQEQQMIYQIRSITADLFEKQKPQCDEISLTFTQSQRNYQHKQQYIKIKDEQQYYKTPPKKSQYYLKYHNYDQRKNTEQSTNRKRKKIFQPYEKLYHHSRQSNNVDSNIQYKQTPIVRKNNYSCQSDYKGYASRINDKQDQEKYIYFRIYSRIKMENESKSKKKKKLNDNNWKDFIQRQSTNQNNRINKLQQQKINKMNKIYQQANLPSTKRNLPSIKRNEYIGVENCIDKLRIQTKRLREKLIGHNYKTNINCSQIVKNNTKSQNKLTSRFNHYHRPMQI